MADHSPSFALPRRPLLVVALLGLLSCHYDRTTGPTGHRIAAVVVTAPRQALAPGDTIQLTAQVIDSGGHVLPAEPVTWSSSTPAVARVDQLGMVIADSVGATTITATAAGQQGHADLAVQVTVLCDCTEILDSAAVTLVSRDDTTGIYVFRVIRGPPPSADSGTILVGAGSGGFLRRVLHSTLVGDLLTVETATAYLEEAVRDGGFSVTQATDSSQSSPAPGQSRFGPWTTTYLAPGVTLTSATCCSISLNGLKLPPIQFKKQTRLGTTFAKAQVTIDSGEITFVPPLNIGAEIAHFQLQSFHTIVGSGLGLELHPYELTVIVGDKPVNDSIPPLDSVPIDSIPRDTLPQDSLPRDSTQSRDKPLLTARQPFDFFIGPVPVVGVVVERLTFHYEVNANASARFKGRFSAGYGVTAGVQWTRDDGWSPVSSATSHFKATAPALEAIQGSVSVRMSVVPEISVIFYEVAGPLLSLEPYAQATAAADATFTQLRLTGFDWSTDVSLGLDLNLGAKISLFGRKDLKTVQFPVHLIKPVALVRDFSDGPLTVRTATMGQDIPDSFWVRLRPAFHDTPPLFGIRDLSTSYRDVPIASTDSAGVLLDDVRSGTPFPHQVTLDSIQGNCYAGNPNPDTVAIGSGFFILLGHPAADTLFNVDCIPFGHLRVRTLTTGPDAAPRYRATLQRPEPRAGTWNGDPMLAIGLPGGPTPPDTVIDSLIPVNPHVKGDGRLAVTLTPGRRNCAAARPDTNIVIVQSGDTVDTQFLVRCVALGDIDLRSATGDPDPPPASDTIRYAALISPLAALDTVLVQPDTLGANDSTLLGGLVPLYNASGAPGQYVVTLGGAPNRCLEPRGFTRSVTVLPGDTARAEFTVRCVERLQVVTRTTGPGIDPDGYAVVVENADGAGAADTVPIGVTDTLGIAGVRPGSHTIALAGVDPTCVAPPPVDRTVSGGDSTLVTFAVSCPAPAPPQDLRATLIDTNRVDLAWTPPAGSVVARYRIYRGGVLHDSSTTPAFSDPGLPPFTGFVYQVSSVDPSGLEGVRTGPLAVRTRDATPPSAPAALTATATSSSRIALAWQPASDAETGVARYVVYRDGAEIARPATTSYVDTGLAGATAYTYIVSAINGDSLEGPRSEPATATTTSSDQDGDLVVYTTTSGTGIPAAFTVQVNKDAFLETQPIAPTGAAAFNGLVPQEYHVRLISLPGNCTVQDVNARKVTVVAGTTVQTTFVVTCQ
jgi:hypothetical protein